MKRLMKLWRPTVAMAVLVMVCSAGMTQSPQTRFGSPGAPASESATVGSGVGSQRFAPDDGTAFDTGVINPGASRDDRARTQTLGTGLFPNGRAAGEDSTPSASAIQSDKNTSAEGGFPSRAPLKPTSPNRLVDASIPIQLGSAGQMIGFSNFDASGTQTITLVHTGKSWMAVYHIDSSGVIRLVSSRPIDADFSLQLNATEPLPEEIRTIGGLGNLGQP